MNEQIKKAREVARGILQPRAADLERGLALHRESVVVESYGLGLMAPVDGTRMAAAIAAGASGLELQDMGEDMRMSRWAEVPELREEFEAACSAEPQLQTAVKSGKKRPREGCD